MSALGKTFRVKIDGHDHTDLITGVAWNSDGDCWVEMSGIHYTSGIEILSASSGVVLFRSESLCKEADYQGLLVKYMAFVMKREGVSLLQYVYPETFTTSEFRILKGMEALLTD